MEDFLSNPTEETKIALMAQDIGYIKAKIEELTKAFSKIADQNITRVEFQPIKQLVYGMVGLILSAVVVGLLVLLGLRLQ